MNSYELTNPRVFDKKFENSAKSDSPKKAAKVFFKALAKNIKNKGAYHFLFTVRDKHSNDYYHFDGHQEVKGGSKTLKISSYKLPTSKKEETADVLGLKQLKGGKKGKKKKSKDDDSSEDDDQAYLDRHQIRALNYPYGPEIFYYYDPFLYQNYWYTDYIILDNYLYCPYLSYPLFNSYWNYGYCY